MDTLPIARLNSARRALETEIQGMGDLIAALAGDLGGAIAEAVGMIAASKGRVIVSICARLPWCRTPAGYRF